MTDTKTQRPGGSANLPKDPQRATETERKGGQPTGGDFAHDRERASEADRKGGQQSGGNFAHDRERMRDQQGGHAGRSGHDKP